MTEPPDMRDLPALSGAERTAAIVALNRLHVAFLELSMHASLASTRASLASMDRADLTQLCEEADLAFNAAHGLLWPEAGRLRNTLR